MDVNRCCNALRDYVQFYSVQHNQQIHLVSDFCEEQIYERITRCCICKSDIVKVLY